MAAISWKFGLSGAWSDASDWSLGLVPTSSDDVTIAAGGTYAIGISKASFADSLTLDASGATLSEVAGSLRVTGAFDLEAGAAILREVNAFGSVSVTGGVLYTYRGASLGAAPVSLAGGEMTAMATQSLADQLSIGGSGATIDAATGDTLNLTNGNWVLDATSAPTLQFGSASRRGVVVWRTAAFSIADSGNYQIDIAGGTLKAGDSSFSALLFNDRSTTIAAGAAIDLAGFSTEINDLNGAGDILDSGKAALLYLNGGFFSGVISGAISVEVAESLQLSAAQTYTGSTTIDSGWTLQTFDKGSVSGAIDDNGTLQNIDSSGIFTAGAISGAGAVTQNGAGELVLDQADTFSGGTTLEAGKLLIGSGAALGTGAFTASGGELIGTASETVANSITLGGDTTLAAATGDTLNLTCGAGTTWDAMNAPLNLVFGDATHKGVVVFGGPLVDITEDYANAITVRVADGTLRANGFDLNFFLTASPTPILVTVDAGATLDIGGSDLTTQELNCAGTITNSSAVAATFGTTGPSKVTGVISGKLALQVESGELTLSGKNTYTGGTTIFSGAVLFLGAGGATGSINGNISDAGSLVVTETGAVSLAGVISGAGTFDQGGKGATTLSGANTYTGGTTVSRGKLVVTNGKALGTGEVTLDNGTTLLATETMALVATEDTGLSSSGSVTIAAATGKTLSIGGGAVDFSDTTLNFGAAGDDGVIDFKVAGGTATNVVMKIDDGTLKAGDMVLGDLIGAATSVSVAAGATLDIGGFFTPVNELLGAGTVTDSRGKAILAVTNGTFTGEITGAIALQDAIDVELTGACSFTGGATIDDGATLQLGAGGASGSITGNVANFGTLVVDETGAVSLAGLISGSGGVDQKGTGVTTLGRANSFTGGVTIARGELVAAVTGALGTGAITFTGGELLVKATGTVSHDLVTTGQDIIAVATGDTVKLAIGAATFNAGTLYFGDSADKGTVIYEQSGALNIKSPLTKVEVRDGVLKAGDSSLSIILSNIEETIVEGGATLDAGGQGLVVHSLAGAGTVTNSGAVTTLGLAGPTSFSGVLAGRFSEVNIFGTAVLSGNQTFTGTAVINSGTLTLSGLFAESVEFNGGGTLILTVPSRFTGKIQDFQSGSTVDLRNVTGGADAKLSYDAATGVLTVSDGTDSDTLTFSGTYVKGNFAVSADGSGGTDVSWQTPPAAAPALASAMAAFGAKAHAPATLGAAHAPPVLGLAAAHG